MLQPSKPLWARFFQTKIPLWFADFERDAFSAVGDLLEGRVEARKFHPYDPNFPGEEIYHWLVTIGQENQFSKNVDKALCTHLCLRIKQALQGKKGDKLSLFWENFLSVLSMKGVRTHLPWSYMLLEKLYAKRHQLLQTVCSQESKQAVSRFQEFAETLSAA